MLSAERAPTILGGAKIGRLRVVVAAGSKPHKGLAIAIGRRLSETLHGSRLRPDCAAIHRKTTEHQGPQMGQMPRSRAGAIQPKWLVCTLG